MITRAIHARVLMVDYKSMHTIELTREQLKALDNLLDIYNTDDVSPRHDVLLNDIYCKTQDMLKKSHSTT